MWMLLVSAGTLYVISFWCIWLRNRGACTEALVGAYLAAISASTISLIYGLNTPEQIQMRAQANAVKYQHCWGTNHMTENCVPRGNY